MARIYRHKQTTGTVEEVILQRKIQNPNLDTISSKQQGSYSSFTDEEVRDCFTLKENCICDTKRKLGPKWEDYSQYSMVLTSKRVIRIHRLTYFLYLIFFQTDGPESLRDQGLEDEVLLKVEKVEEIVLTYVHIAKENEESIVKDETNKLSDYNDDGDDDASESELEKGFSSDSSDEVEFEE